MDAVRPYPTRRKTTSSSPSIVTFDPATLVAYAIRRAANLTPDDRVALANRLERLPPPDDAAGRLIARRLRRLTS